MLKPSIALALCATAVSIYCAAPALAGDGAGGGAGVLSGLTNYSMSRHEAASSFSASPLVPNSLMFNTGVHSTEPAAGMPGTMLTQPATGFGNPNESAATGLSNPVLTLSGSGSLGGASFPAPANGQDAKGASAAINTSNLQVTNAIPLSDFALRAIMPGDSSSKPASQMGSNNYESGLYEPNSWTSRFNNAKPGEVVH